MATRLLTLKSVNIALTLLQLYALELVGSVADVAVSPLLTSEGPHTWEPKTVRCCQRVRSGLQQGLRGAPARSPG